MGRDSDDSKDGGSCPLHCRSQNGDTSADQVDWAGLPVNLDFAFSPSQRDKVYAQHLRLRRGTLLRRRSVDVKQVCVCEMSGYGRADATV